MPNNAAKSGERKITLPVVLGILSLFLTIPPLFFQLRGLAGTAEPPAKTGPSPAAPGLPAPAFVPQPVVGCLHLRFESDPPSGVVVLLQGHEVPAKDDGPRLKIIDNLMPGDCQVTVRVGDRQFQELARMEAGKTTTLWVRLPAAKHSVKPPASATGTLVLDLPQDACADLQVTLNGERQAPSFKTSRALGFIMRAGVYEVRVCHRSREFRYPAVVRAGAHTLVRVVFPQVRLLLEFIEEVPANVQFMLGGVVLAPTSRGRRCCEFTVAPGTHAVLVRDGSREFRTKVVIDKAQPLPITVDLGKERTPPVKAGLVTPKQPARNRPAAQICTFTDVWSGSTRLRNRLVRVTGWGIIYSLNDGFLFRYRENKENVVNCHISLGDIGPLEGKVTHGKSLVVTLEGEVSGSAGRVVTMKNCRVICVEP